ncbi:MAG: transposase [Methylotenera sp.]|uniref:transposase n=1 Tax=Methylotenera sp. TaxID=2051956 RepID=UPI00272F6EFD|nr:transposase [Methylotenera sp.]MDP1521715.1 transposase [Methylotenera sp.]MDP3307496.1 transposase [Methylotenera sp.]MDZ4211629.1 transposase [Methylotenera sp.]
MARLPRYNVINQPQHIILRGNNRSIIFVSDDDYRFFLTCLHDAASQHGCSIYAYVLMTNHVHLLMSPHEENSISKTMQSVGRRYVQYFNYLQQRTGTLWEGRYKSTLIDSEAYLLRCYRYIELNPVRANMVALPIDYVWSSYANHAESKENTLLTEHPLYLALGRDADARRQSYRDLFKHHLDEVDLQSIRNATNKGWVLGKDSFKDEMSAATNRRLAPLPKGRPKTIEIEPGSN